MTKDASGDEPIRSNIILLGLVSLLNDSSGEIIQPILPLFIASLGGGGVAIGLVGGLSDGIPIPAFSRSSPATGRISRAKGSLL